MATTSPSPEPTSATEDDLDRVVGQPGPNPGEVGRTGDLEGRPLPGLGARGLGRPAHGDRELGDGRVLVVGPRLDVGERVADDPAAHAGLGDVLARVLTDVQERAAGRLELGRLGAA